jgi:hypothetical protein
MHPESDYGRMIGGSFRECLGGFAACGLLRKNFPQSSAFSRPKRISWGQLLKQVPLGAVSFDLLMPLLWSGLAQIDNPPSRAYLNRQVAVLISFGSAGFNRLVVNSEILPLDSVGIVDRILRLRAGTGRKTRNRRRVGIRDTRGIVQTTVIGELPHDPFNE